MNVEQEMIGKPFLYQNERHTVLTIEANDDSDQLWNVKTDNKNFKQPIHVRKKFLRKEFIALALPPAKIEKEIVKTVELETVTSALLAEITKLGEADTLDDPVKLKMKLDRSKALNEVVKTYINLQKNKIAIVKLMKEK